MTLASTVVAFKSALTQAVVLAVNDANVQVVYGRPPEALVRREAIFVADVDYTSEVANMRAGRAHYDESFAVDVVCVAAKARGEAAAAEARAFALFEFVRGVVAAEAGKQGLGVDGVWGAWVERVTMATSHESEGPVSVVVATVRVRARVE